MYKTKHTLSQSYNKPKYNIIAFDLDETLGQFSQLGFIVECIEYCENTKLVNTDFFKLVDILYKFLRPNLIEILQYIKTEKQKMNESNTTLQYPQLKVIIYTNNQGPLSWAKLICEYLNNKLDYKLFDDVIGAFKVKGTIMDSRRTSNSKRHSDIINILNCDKNSKILFFDDIFHHEMDEPHVTYIHLVPYKFQYTNKEIINLYLQNFIISNEHFFRSCMNQLLMRYKYNDRKNYILPSDNNESMRIFKECVAFIDEINKTISNTKHTLHGGKIKEPIIKLRRKSVTKKSMTSKVASKSHSFRNKKHNITQKKQLKKLMMRMKKHKAKFMRFLTRKKKKQNPNHTFRKKHYHKNKHE